MSEPRIPNHKQAKMEHDTTSILPLHTDYFYLYHYYKELHKLIESYYNLTQLMFLRPKTSTIIDLIDSVSEIVALVNTLDCEQKHKKHVEKYQTWLERAQYNIGEDEFNWDTCQDLSLWNMPHLFEMPKKLAKQILKGSTP